MIENITRRSALATTGRAALAVVAGSGIAGAAPAGGADRILALLRKRQAFIDSLNSRSDDDLEDDDPRWIAVDALEDEIIGTPALTAAGALACMRAVETKGCHSATDEWLLEAVTGFLRRLSGEEVAA